MRYRLLAALLFFVPRTSFAIKPASNDDIRAIQALIDQAREMDQGDIAVAKKKLSVAIALNDREQIKELQADINLLTRERDTKRNKAIHLTLRAYDLVPVDPTDNRLRLPSGVLVLRGFEGKSADWIPIADDGGPRPIVDKRGRIKVSPEYPEAMAVTYSNGVTVMKPESFTTPGLLALTLLHEREHFRQSTTPGVGDTLTRAQKEVQAYTIESYNMKKIGLTPDELDLETKHLYGNPQAGWKGALIVEREKVALEQRRMGLKWPWSDDGPDSFAYRTQDKGDLWARFDELDHAIASEIALVKARREYQERLSRQHATPVPSMLPPVTEWPPGNLISLIAQIACNDPAALTQEEVDRLVPDHKLAHSDLGDCHTAAEYSTLPGCARSVFESICAEDGGAIIDIDREVILSQADRFRPQSSPTPSISPSKPPDQISPVSPPLDEPTDRDDKKREYDSPRVPLPRQPNWDGRH